MHIHFIGIGGVGMNGLAQLAALTGYKVTGSDRCYHPDTELFRYMARLGIRIFPQDGSAIAVATERVVYSTAIESDNPDIQQANRLGIPLAHRAEFLKHLVGDDELVAIAGTAGKTTTTGMLGWIFDCLGKDPSVYNGAAVLNWKQGDIPGNVRKGSSRLWIIEADESDKSFLNFRPTHSIITNISKDHYELDELHRMFDQFRSQTSGLSVVGTCCFQQGKTSSSFVFEDIEFHVPVLGKHNLENALCAVRLCAGLGMDLRQVRDSIARFNGIERRLELTGSTHGITIFDDYAHNPAKIAAALEAVAETAGSLHAYWRPHGFTPLFQNMDDLVDIFSSHWKKHGGTVSILPVYYAGGTVEKKATASDLVDRINSAGAPAKLMADYASLKRELEENAKPGDAILGMGARDPELPLFAKRLVAEWKNR